MDRLRRSFRDSFRRRKDRVPESSKPHQWQADEEAVRTATCSFSVKYLGCVEVFESRGMQVCEEALKVLRVSLNMTLKNILFQLAKHLEKLLSRAKNRGKKYYKAFKLDLDHL